MDRHGLLLAEEGGNELDFASSSERGDSPLRRERGKTGNGSNLTLADGSSGWSPGK